MKKIISVTSIIIILLTNASGQSKTGDYRDGSCKKSRYTFCPKNVLYHETETDFNYLTFNSINWEGTLICKTKFILTLRLGGIYYNFGKPKFIGAPADLNFLFGGGKWLVDAGIGGRYFYIYENYDVNIGSYSDNLHFAGVNAHLGLRYEIQESMFFKIAVDPMYSVYNYQPAHFLKNKFNPLYAIAIGYTFDD